jgi:hypothetical protein
VVIPDSGGPAAGQAMIPSRQCVIPDRSVSRQPCAQLGMRGSLEVGQVPRRVSRARSKPLAAVGQDMRHVRNSVQRQ